MRIDRVHGGFTLVELVTTIVILGILGAIAGPRMFERSPFTERGYADEIAAALRTAQKVAVASGCDVQVIVDLAGYRANQRSAAGTTCATAGNNWTVPVLRVDGTPLSGTPPSDANVLGATQLIFMPRGGLLGAVAAISVGGHTVRVDASTGLVEVT